MAGIIAAMGTAAARPPFVALLLVGLAADRCEARAQAAQGPTGTVTLGASTRSGPRVGASVGLSGDYLAGRDPVEVYERCVYNLTGQAPIRPPRLRGA